MIFVDASAYIGLLIPADKNHEKAIQISKDISVKGEDIVTSYGILGEVLTVGSQRHNRRAAIDFVSDILESKTSIIMENAGLIDQSLKIFKKINDKDVSWIDCYSFAIVKEYKIKKVFSFDRDFQRYAEAMVLT